MADLSTSAVLLASKANDKNRMYISILITPGTLTQSTPGVFVTLNTSALGTFTYSLPQVHLNPDCTSYIDTLMTGTPGTLRH